MIRFDRVNVTLGQGLAVCAAGLLGAIVQWRAHLKARMVGLQGHRFAT